MSPPLLNSFVLSIFLTCFHSRSIQVDGNWVGLEVMDSTEISLRDVFTKVWRLRGLIVSIIFLSLLLAGLWVLKTATDFRNPVSYFVTLRNIENSKFPNGTAFSPQDLLIPQVVDALRTRFDIPQQTDLRNFVSVEYDSPMAAAVSMKYSGRLAARGINQTDIDNLNESYRSELQGLMQSGLRIDVDYAGLGVDKSTGISIAVAIPQIWSDIYSKQFRIFADTRLEGVAVTYSDENLDSSTSVITAKTRLDSIDKGLSLLSKDNRLASVTTRENKSAMDIIADLNRFRAVYFNPIFAESDDNGDRVSAIYMRERNLTVADWKRRADGLDRTLSDLREYQNSGKVSGNWETASAAREAISGGQNIQVADGALGQIIELTNKASLADYMKTVLDQRQVIVEQISTLQKEIDLTQGAAGIEISPQFREAAASELSHLTSDYQELLSIARQRMIDGAGDLYLPLSPPAVAGSIFTVRSLIAFPIFLVIGVIISMALVVLWPERRPRPLISVLVPDLRMTANQ